MNSFQQKLYDHSPWTVKNILVSLRGVYLNWWRYGKETEQLFKDAKEREYWSAKQWEKWKSDRLGTILHAAKEVPYYQEKMGSKISEDLSSWPILTKNELRINNFAFVQRGMNTKKMFCDHTSGSSGTPLSIWQTRETVRQWYALSEGRWRGWYGISRRDPWAIFGGQIIINQERNKPPFWVYNYPMRQLYMSVYHISEKTVKDYAEALWKFKPSYIYGYASALYTLVYETNRQSISLPPVMVVLSNAEPLYDYQKEVISKAFHSLCLDTYGLSEFVVGASECENSSLHIWPETGIFEILDDDNQPVKDGETGRLISTGLLNTEMPLIRYETGDRVALDTLSQCECGRTMPVITKIEGRNDDMIKTLDGRKIGRLYPVFKHDLNIKEAQIIQTSFDHILVKVVPNDHYSDKDMKIIQNELKKRLGEIEITIDTVSSIARNKAGKFKAVVSLIDK